LIKDLTDFWKKGKISIETKRDMLERLIPASEIDLFTQCSLVIEAVNENMEIKTNIFSKLDEIWGVVRY